MQLRKTAFWLSVIFIFIIPWESGAVVEGVGPVARGVGLAVTAFWLGVVLITGRFRRLHPFHIAVLLFLLWNVMSLLWTINTQRTFDRLETYVQLTVMVFLIWDLYTTKNRVRIGLQAYVLGAYITVWSVLGNYFSGVTTGQSGRFSGFNFNENTLALILVIALGFAWYLAVSANVDEQKKRSWGYLLRLANYAFVPLALFAIILTASRTAVISAIPFFWFMLGSTTRLKPSSRLLVAVGMVIALLFLQPLVPQTSIERLSTTSGELTEGDLNGRRQLWEIGKEAFLQRPINGWGSGVFKTLSGGQVAHNTYLSVLAESGFIGFVFFSAMMFTALFQVKKLDKLMAVLWLTIFLSWAIGVSSMTWELRKPTWLIMSLALASGHALAQEQVDLPAAYNRYRQIVRKYEAS